MNATLTEEQARHLAALEAIDVAANGWREALEAAIEAGCAPEAIQNRVTGLVSSVFGVDPATLGR